MNKISKNLATVSMSLFISMLLFSVQVDAKIDPDSAMAIWLLNEGEGTEIMDSSGNNNHGELQGGQWVDGPSGPALSLNGQNDRVIIPDSDSLYAAEGWTITAWVFVNSGETGYGHIVGKRAATGQVVNYAFRVSSNGAHWEAYYSRGGWKGVWNQGTVRKDTWLYMTATYDGVDTIKLYENGTEFSSTNGYGGPAPRDTEEVHIGGWTNNTSETLNGMLYDVAIFNVALSAEDINTLKNDGLAGVLPVEPIDKLATTWGSIKSRK